jgi:hypothetical protein
MSHKGFVFAIRHQDHYHEHKQGQGGWDCCKHCSMHSGFQLAIVDLNCVLSGLKTWQMRSYALSFFSIGKLFRKRWYIPLQSVVKRTA